MDPFSRWQTLPAMMLGLGVERGTRPMLRRWVAGRWETVSWGVFAAQAASLARGLSAHVVAGAAVLLVSEGRPEVVIANVALQTIGAVPMPGYVTNTPEDHAHLLRDSGARVAIVSTAVLAARVVAAAERAGGLDLLVCMEAFATGACAVLDWGALVDGSDDVAWAQARAAEVSPEAVAVLMYTSGTSGLPRGVQLPHRAILSNCRGAAVVVEPLHLTDELYLSILPLSHTYEYTVGQYFLSGLGCEVVFCRGVEHLAADMQAVAPHIMTVVPRVLDVIRGRVLAEVARASGWRRAVFARALAGGLRRLDGRARLVDRLADPLLERLVRARVRARFGGRIVAIVSGGARLDPEVGRFFLAMGLRVMQGYGLTEAGPVISVNPPFAVRTETVGPPLPGVELRIDADGEILVRGDLVMAGYLGAPVETAAAIEDGWLRTGDVGVMDGGYLRITDRKKDIIVLSGGENVSPARIEAMLMEQGEISQAVVMGDGRVGLAGLLVAAEGVDAAGVAAAVGRVNAGLAGVERLRRHELVGAFTLDNGLMTPTLKIRRRLVIARYAQGAAGGS